MTFPTSKIPPEMNRTEYHYTESGEVELILTQGHARNYPWHIHAKHWTVGLLRFGSATLATPTETRKLYPGQYFSLRPYEPHSLSVARESLLIVSCFDEAISLLKLGDMCRHGRYFNEILETSEFISTAMACTQHSRTEQGSILHDTMRAVADMIMEKPDDSSSLGEMASHAGYSLWYFLRSFRKEIGMTPHSFLILCRLRLLRSLLRTDAAMSDMAVSAGFSDQSHMYKIFKRHHEMTPRQFRQASFKLTG